MNHCRASLNLLIGGTIIKKQIFQKLISWIGVFVVACGLSSGRVLAQLQIMPLGDSITMGRHGEPSGYRDDLAILLLNENIDFDFVGSVNDGSGFYPRHEGHSGWRADEIYSQLNRWLNMNPPDIVLLHIGTNDISEGETNASTIDEIEDIINLIHQKNSSTIILLCSLIPRFDPYYNRPEITDQLNDLIFDLFNYKLSVGFDIYFVDQENAFKQNSQWTQEYMDDYVHPNDLGYHVMAETFYQVLMNIFEPNVYVISGNVLYYSNDEPLNNVMVTLSGSQNLIDQTGANGFYEFINLPGNASYHIQPAREKIEREENKFISMYNAALALRHAVGIETLAPDNQIAADVDRDGQIIAYDAALIARYVVELPEVSNDFVGEWIFSPAERNINNLTNDLAEQNFRGYLLGDIVGAWNQPELTVSKELSAWAAEIEMDNDRHIFIPIKICEDTLLSCEVELEYATNALQFVSVKNNQPNMQFVYNSLENRIKAGVFGSTPIAIDGNVFEFEFIATGNSGQSGEIALSKLIVNNERIRTDIAKLNVAGNAIAFKKVTLGDNHPNPFNPATTIPYELFEAGEVNIKIFNLIGQEIKTLFNSYQNAGSYQITWDGTDKNGMAVANGLYMCSVTFQDQVITKRLTKIE